MNDRDANASAQPWAVQNPRPREDLQSLRCELTQKDEQLFELSAALCTVEAESTHRISRAESEAANKVSAAQEDLRRLRTELWTANAALAEQKKRNAEMQSALPKERGLKSPEFSSLWKDAERREEEMVREKVEQEGENDIPQAVEVQLVSGVSSPIRHDAPQCNLAQPRIVPEGAGNNSKVEVPKTTARRSSRKRRLDSLPHYHDHVVEILMQCIDTSPSFPENQAQEITTLERKMMEEDNTIVRSLLLNMHANANVSNKLSKEILALLLFRSLHISHGIHFPIRNLIVLLYTLLTHSAKERKYIKSQMQTKKSFAKSLLTALADIITSTDVKLEAMNLLLLLGWDAKETFWISWCDSLSLPEPQPKQQKFLSLLHHSDQRVKIATLQILAKAPPKRLGLEKCLLDFIETEFQCGNLDVELEIARVLAIFLRRGLSGWFRKKSGLLGILAGALERRLDLGFHGGKSGEVASAIVALFVVVLERMAEEKKNASFLDFVREEKEVLCACCDRIARDGAEIGLSRATRDNANFLMEEIGLDAEEEELEDNDCSVA